ncbi:hypothetical protein PsorP6_015125 [Peronosclerospora sorghi]|uniref:Uncharacterized protein n=1 Tax=Peronosclerospora sorghi TaxID=230839 RepID=A0ACC0VUL4_9STRA|nr:hypothetical protein PsorP6_015125 [Peronosclerospora sorghi]
MDERSTGRKGTPLPIYVGGPSGRRVPRRKSYSRRGSRSQSSDDVSPSKKSFVLIEGRMWKVLWALFLVAFVICVACLLILGHTVQDGKFSNTDVTAGKGGIFSAWRDNQMLAKLEPLSSMFTSVEDAKVKYQITKEQLRNLGDYECIGWRQTRNCTPSGERDVENDRNCSALISNGVSGYCEVRNTRTGETNHVMQMHCDSLRIGVRFRCNMFQTLLSYSILSTDYEHDPNFSYPHNQEVFRATNKLSNTPIPLGNDGLKNESVGQLQLSFDRGIVMVVYEKLLLGAYVSVRSLRALGCTLPIEMWYKSSETSVEHPLLRHMVDELNVYLRHDSMGHVIFLHRNTEKLTYGNNRLLWTHIQQYKRTAAPKDYYVRGANGGKVFPEFKRCFGKDVHYDKLFTLKPMSAFPFENIEKDLLRYATEGAELVNNAGHQAKG